MINDDGESIFWLVLCIFTGLCIGVLLIELIIRWMTRR